MQNPAAEVSRWDREGTGSGSAPAIPIFDDELLARSIRTGNDVYVPMHVTIVR